MKFFEEIITGFDKKCCH